ncbi:hypothetical protein PGH24_07625 [Thermoanaerobacterium thermosaccharolyticum]|nr:hypothetical protein PGH24_07625 [Thermoanaerobacterium thermosaccharolyticum]
MALEKEDNEIIDISTNKVITINEFADMMNDIIGTYLKHVILIQEKVI